MPELCKVGDPARDSELGTEGGLWPALRSSHYGQQEGPMGWAGGLESGMAREGMCARFPEPWVFSIITEEHERPATCTNTVF